MTVTIPKSSDLIQTKDQTINWLSLIYLPGNEINSVNQDFLISGAKPNRRIPFYRAFQFVDPDTGELRSIVLHPGTNLGYHVRNNMDNTEIIRKITVKILDAIQDNSLNKEIIDKAFKIVYPKNAVDIEGLPYYRDFSENDAIELVNSHTHERWIDIALVGENRSSVKTAAEARKIQIIEYRRKLQEGIF